MKQGSVRPSAAVWKGDLDNASCGYLVSSTEIEWNVSERDDAQWAMNCDWIGNELSDAGSTDEQCAGKCRTTAGCTHFTWTSSMGGTCWMKKGRVNGDDAVPSSDTASLCGYLNKVARLTFYIDNKVML
jgi:hypothetical protein